MPRQKSRASPALRTLGGDDPAAAAGSDPRNVRRVVRALEVVLTTGRPISAQRGKTAPPYRILMIGLMLPRLSSIDASISAWSTMIGAGLEAEVRRLVAAGYGLTFRPCRRGLWPIRALPGRTGHAGGRGARHQARYPSLCPPPAATGSALPTAHPLAGRQTDPFPEARHLLHQFLSAGPRAEPAYKPSHSSILW